MDTQVRTAKAVVDIDEVHFYKHSGGEPTITQNLLDSKDSQGQALNPDPWFSTTTIKGSVEVTQDALSLTKINIDQSNMPIGISTEPGDFNITFTMPDMTKDKLKNWLAGNYTDQSYTQLHLGNKQGYGYDFNAELVDMVMAIKTKTGEWFIFPNTQGSVCMIQDNKVFCLKYQGQVLGASNSANHDVYILSTPYTAPVANVDED